MKNYLLFQESLFSSWHQSSLWLTKYVSGYRTCRSTREAMVTHSSTLAWKIPWVEEPGGLQSMGSLSCTQLSDFTFTFYSHSVSCLFILSVFSFAVQKLLSLIRSHFFHLIFSTPCVWKWKWSHSVVSDSLWPHGLQPARLFCPWDSPGKNTGVGCHALLPPQGIFLTQGLN